MPLRHALVLLLLATPLCQAADLRTLAGTTVSGDLVGISTKEIVIKTATEQVTTPLDQVLDLTLVNKKEQSVFKEVTYTDVELTDGTLLHCGQVGLKGKQVELTLLADRQIKVPLEAISYIQKEASDDKRRRDWQERFLNKKRSRDLLIVKKPGTETLDRLEGTIGEADEEGKKIEFVSAEGTKLNVALSRIEGMIFQRGPDPNAAPILCKFHDTRSNVLMVSSLAQNDKGITVTTSAGAKVDYAMDMVARLDFSKGKLTYLSDDAFWTTDKVKLVQSSTEDRIEEPRRDKNLDNGQIRLGGISYPRGLSVHSRTELEYVLEGEYREFKAIIGVDDMVGGGDSPTVVRIEGDGKELLSMTITRKDKPRPVRLNIKDVQRLKLVVGSGDLLDLGKHVDFADAKVSK